MRRQSYGEGRWKILVIAAGREASSVREDLATMGAVSMVLSPRVLVVEGDRDFAAAITEMPGVELATTEPVPQGVVDRLTEVEAAQVAAWNSRLRQDKKVRPGDGLSWDAEGFEPP